MRRLLTMVLWSVLAAGCSGAGAPGSGAAEAEAAAAGATGDTAVSAGTAAGNGTTAAGIPREITPAIAQGPLPLGVSRLQPATIMDASGFEKPVVAASVLVPVGWRAQGGYVWNVGNPCAAGDYQLNWSVSAPDGISAVAFVVKPKWLIVKFFMQFDRGPPSPCEGPDWTTTRQYLEGLARQSSPQVRLLDYQERPDLAREQQAAIDAIDRMIPQSPTDLMQSRTRAEAGQILFAHTVNGREVREMIVAVMMFTERRTADLLNPGQIAMVTIDGLPLSVIYARAPAGELNVQLPGVIAKSLRPTAEWSRRVFQYNMEKQRRAFEAMIRQGQHSALQLQQMREANDRSVAARSEAQAQRDRTYDLGVIAGDRQQREFVEAIRGVETYHEPVAGGVVQLDNTYDHAWRVRDGSYLLSNDPNFRPGLVGLEGEELQRVK